MVEIQEVQLTKKPKREMRKSSAKIRNCLYCGSEFIARNQAHKFCSIDCQRKYNHKPKTKEYDTKMVKINGEYKWVRNGVVLDE